MQELHSFASRTGRAWLAALATVVLVASVAPPVGALTVSGKDIDPVYLAGPNPTLGLADGSLTPTLEATTDYLVLSAGSDPSSALLVVIPDELDDVLNNPQFRNPAENPSFSDPLVADSTWTITNNTDSAILAPVLLFTTFLDPNGDYPDDGVGLDANLLEILRVTSDQQQQTLFGAVPLCEPLPECSLAPGESTTILVRYVIAGPVPIEQVLEGGKWVNKLVLPELGVAGLAIPEPGTFALVAAGLVGLAVRRRRCGAA